MESKKPSNRNKNTSKRSSKKRKGLFKTKKIKPKVKLDSNKVLWFCVIISIACILLLLATLYLPDFTNKTNSSQFTAVEQTEQTDGENVQLEKKETKDQEAKKVPEKKREHSQKDEKSSINNKADNKTDNSKNNIEKKENSTVKENKNSKVNKEPQTQETKKSQKQKEAQEAKKAQEEQRQKQKALEEQRKKEEAIKLEEQKKNQEKEKSASFNFPKAVNNAQIVVVLDDGGQNINHLNQFLELPIPLTIAVLPGYKFSTESAVKISNSSAKELMLHQPMQALNLAINPGPGAIKPDMSDEQVRAVLAENLNQLNLKAVGFNNHEGSAITADPHMMEVVLKFASDNGVFFLDSRTNKDTKVPYVSGALGYSYYERNGEFIDNEHNREGGIVHLRKNLEIANRDGYVIMIGHVWSAPWLAQLLKEVYPELREKGYTFTTVSKCKGRK